MSSLAVVKTGGKQYIVKNGDEIVVDKVDGEVGAPISLPKLAEFLPDGTVCTVDPRKLSSPVTAQIIETGKGDKIRVAKFKAKVRYRRVAGFRPHLTKLKITSI